MIAMTAGWARAYDPNDDEAAYNSTLDNQKDEADIIFLALPVTMDGIAVTPFYATGIIGKDNDDLNQAGTKDEHPWWLGVNAKVDMLDPIVILADLDYGKWNSDNDTRDSSGWYFDLAVDYKMDMMTPEVFFVYSSGDDSNDNDGSERMPTLSTEAYGPTTFGFAGSSFAKADGVIGCKTSNGTTSIDWSDDAGLGLGLWALGFKLKDMTFMEGLSHDFILMYARGTNDKKNTSEFTEKDSLWEVDLNTKYQMYENLAAIVELGYVKVNLSDDESADRDKLADDAAWKMAVGFKYDF
jgi:predicted porin